LATIGCGQEGSGPVATEADSAGIRIVTNERPLEDWVLTDEPEVELGNLAAPGLTEFFQVEAARFLSNERFVVANRGTEELRFFGTDGAFLGATGGGGRGPEEFQGLSWLAVVGDSLLAYDWGNDRLSVRDHSGTYGRSFRLEWVSGLLTPLAPLSDSTLLSLSVRHMTELAGTGTLLDLGLVSRHDLTGAVIDSLGRFPVGERVVHREGNRQTTIGLPLSAVASFASHGDGFCYVFGPEFQVRCLDPQGVPTTIARVDSLPRAVTPEDVERTFEHELDVAREAGNGPREQALLRARPSMTFPETLPAFTELLADDQNRIWARRYALPGPDIVEWWIFDDERWVGRIRMDPAFQAMDVRGNRVLGVWRDGLGIEHIRIHRFEAL
jgi:hypothetical protein